MKFWKLFIVVTFIFYTFLSCEQAKEQETTMLMILRYDKQKDMLLIDQMESSRTLKRIDLDLQQDTLVISKIIKKQVPFYGEPSVRKAATCIVTFPANIEFVKLGGKLYKISEMIGFSQDKLLKIGVPIIIVPLSKFPCVIE